MDTVFTIDVQATIRVRRPSPSPPPPPPPLPQQRRIFMHCHDWRFDYKPQERIDEVVGECGGWVTDLILPAKRISKPLWLGASPLTLNDSRRLDGLTVLDYFIREAHAVGLRIHTELCIGRWPPWQALVTPAPEAWNCASLPGDECNSEDWLNMSIPEARQIVANVAESLLSVHDLDGIVADFIRYSGGSHEHCPDLTIESIDLIIAELHRVTSAAGIELFGDLSGLPRHESRNKQCPANWIEQGTIDILSPRNYLNPVEECLEFLEILPAHDLPVCIGIEANPNSVEQEEFERRLHYWLSRGYGLKIQDWPRILKQDKIFLEILRATLREYE